MLFVQLSATAKKLVKVNRIHEGGSLFSDHPLPAWSHVHMHHHEFLKRILYYALQVRWIWWYFWLWWTLLKAITIGKGKWKDSSWAQDRQCTRWELKISVYYYFRNQDRWLVTNPRVNDHHISFHLPKGESGSNWYISVMDWNRRVFGEHWIDTMSYSGLETLWLRISILLSSPLSLVKRRRQNGMNYFSSPPPWRARIFQICGRKLDVYTWRQLSFFPSFDRQMSLSKVGKN